MTPGVDLASLHREAFLFPNLTKFHIINLVKIAYKFILPILTIALLIFGAVKLGLLDFRTFPEPKGEKQVILNCNYHGQKLSVQENLYQSVDDFYKSNPKKRFLSYDAYTKEDPKDKTIEDLTEKIKTKAQELGLTLDQTADLATCFVQTIPYDSDKAKIVLSDKPEDKVTRITNNNYFDRFPYETLYDDKGICTDKSYLESAILKQMGYGAALLTFDTEKHMAVGIKTPAGYGSFNTDYAYIETTNTGYRVGQLPIMDKSLGGAKKAEISKLSGDSSQDIIPELPQSDFSPPSKVIKVADGGDYQRIIDITKENQRLKDISTEINTQNRELTTYKDDVKNAESQAGTAKSQLDQSEVKVNQAKSDYNQNPTEESYAAYRQVYSDYQTTYYQTKSVIDNYNAKVNAYNQKVKELNSLIDEYNQLVKND